MSEKEIFSGLFHKVRLIDKDGEKIGKMILYMSEYDSGIGEPCIALDSEETIICTKDIKLFQIIE